MMHVCGGERGRRRRAECQRSPARGVGEGRLLGDDDWSPAGRALDAIRGRWVLGDFDVEVLGAVLTDPSTPDSLHPFGELRGARAAWLLDRFWPSRPTASRDLRTTTPRRASGAPCGGRRSPARSPPTGTPADGSGGSRARTRAAGSTPSAPSAGPSPGAGHVSRKLDGVLWQPSFGLEGSYASGDRGTGAFSGFDPWTPLDLALGYSFLALGDGARTIPADAGIGGTSGGARSVRGASTLHFAYASVSVALP
jgi:hypothetical protein